MEILIAEDNSILCNILETFLRRWGYDVLVAQDGTEAYRQLDRDDRPALAPRLDDAGNGRRSDL